MPFFKQVELKDAIEKYGFSHSGLFAKGKLNLEKNKRLQIVKISS